MNLGRLKMRSISFGLALLMMLALFAPLAYADAGVEASGEKPGTLARAYLTTMTETIGTRVAGTEGEAKAASYLKETLTSMGYEVKTQSFKFLNREKKMVSSSNIIAVKPGASKKEIIVGAHYDNATVGLGADDNASSVAVMLETAKFIKNMETPYTIRFIAFGAEEAGDRGSTAYVKSMSKKAKSNTLLMVNMDSLIAGDNMYVYGDYGKGGLVRDYVMKSARLLDLKVGTNMGENPEYPLGTTGDWSDHAPFMDAGIPYIYFEGTNWLLGDKDGYTQVGDKYGDKGLIWHTEFDNLKYMDETFPGRVDEHLNTYTVLLEKVVTEYRFPEKK